MRVITEAFEGVPLSNLAVTARRSLENFLEIGAAAANALGCIHARNIHVGDISVNTIWHDHRTGRAVYTDFIHAMPMVAGIVPMSRFLSKMRLDHLAPEMFGRWLRNPDWRADLYALGVTLYALLTGRLPFTDTDPLALLHAQMSNTPEPPSCLDNAIPEAVSNIVMRLLAKEPDDRYQSAFGLQADLEDCRHCLEVEGTVWPFTLGRHDSCDIFRLSEKLYGRDKERALLLDAVGRLMEGCRELVLVSGYSGIGKTSLIEELRHPTTVQGIRFVSSKFESLRRNIPFSALADGLRKLIRGILEEPATVIASWSANIRAALGNIGQVLVDLIPELEELIGPQPPVPQVPPREVESRFSMAFLNFLRAVCRPEHPLAIFLDDLQWADAASLSLLEKVLADAELDHFLCLGAYRDNEVDNDHPLSQTRNALREAKAHTTSIVLGPLDAAATVDLLADTFRTEVTQIRELGAVLHLQTEGNPFFLRQTLTALYEEGLIVFIPSRGSWEWDMDGIAVRGLAENAADLLARKIGQLSRATGEILLLASCLGSVFDLADLAGLTGMAKADLAIALEPALCAGLVRSVPPEPQSGASPWPRWEQGERFAFVHDRVRESAATFRDARDLADVHRRIASMLLTQFPSMALEQRLFELTDHLNRALPVIASPAERLDIAAWNLKACRKAREATAFAAALVYARQGMALLPPDAWISAYALALALHIECGRAEHLNLHFEAAEVCYERCIAGARTLQDRCECINMRISQWCMIGRMHEAVEEAKRELALYGIRIPEDDIEAVVAEEVENIFSIMAGKSPAAYLDLPAMTDPLLVAASSIIDGIAPTAYFHDRKLLALLGCISVKLALEHGYTVGTIPALTSHGRLLASITGNDTLNYEFGKLALDLCRKHNIPQALAYCMSVYLDAAYLFETRETIDFLLKEGIQAAIASGDMYHLELIQSFSFFFNFLSGKNIKSIFREIFERYLSKKILPSVVSYCFSLMLCLGLKDLILEDFTDEFALIDAQQLLEKAHQWGQFSSFAYMYHVKGMSCHMLGRRTEALAAFAKAEEYSPGRDLIIGYEFTFFHPLALLAACDAWPPADGEVAHKIEAHRRKLRTWAQINPEVFQARHLLLEAEVARVQGAALETILDLYDGAIATAKANDLAYITALSEETAGNFWLSRNKTDFARGHLIRAVRGYRDWGADRKARDLAATHRVLLASLEPAPLPQADRESLATMGLAGLDLSSLMKAAGAIAGEIVLPRLAATLTHLAAENAGAQRCLLVLKREAGLTVLPRMSDTADPKATPEEILLDDFPDAPASIVRLVAEKRLPLIVEDAQFDARFAADPYVARARSRSILCAPITRQETLLGAIYLENNLIRGAFTPQRLEIVSLLAAQAAISLENARLYEEVRQAEAKYREVFENAQEGIFRTAVDGRVLLVNPAAIRMLGYDTDARQLDAITNGHVSIYADAAQQEALLGLLRQGRMALGREILLRRRDGGCIWALVNARPILDDAGRLVAVEGLFADITRRKEADSKIRQLNTELLRLQDQEWSRISMNLHDDVAQNLLTAKILASRLVAGCPDLAASQTVQTRLAELLEVIGESIATVRDLSVTLRPPNLASLGLVDALRNLCEDTSEKTGQEVLFHTSGMHGLQIAYETQVNMYRLAQEALNNVHKHAMASQVLVRLIASAGSLRLQIEDNGKGFDLKATSATGSRSRHLGLSTMRERAGLLGGHLDIVSRPGFGTHISLEIPSCGGDSGQDRSHPAH